jgi:hypothetical protein
MLTKSRTDAAFPKRVCEKILQVEPSLMKLRIENELPKNTASNNEREDPSLATPYTDKVDPRRA